MTIDATWNRIAKWTLPVILLEACFSLAWSQEETDRARDLLLQSVQAIGDPATAREWTTRSDRGQLTAFWPGWGTLRADCRQFIKKPDKMKLDQDFSVYNHPFFFSYYYSAGHAWMMVNLGTRENPMITKRLTRTMRSIDDVAYFHAECETLFVVEDAASDSLLDASIFDRIGIVDHGDTLYVDLDRKTHLPVRRIEDGGNLQTLFADYRETNARKMPFQVTVYESGSRTAEYIWKEIHFGELLDDAIFEEFRPEATAQ